MKKSLPIDAIHWNRRIMDSRRKYFFEHLRKLNGLSGFSFLQTFKWMKDDAVYTAKWGINILLQLRAYGSVTKKRYGISLRIQAARMMYLAFIKRLEPKYFRSYHLFKQERWNNVDRFAFDQYHVQYQLMDRSFPEEKEILKNKFSFYTYCRDLSIHTPEVIAVFIAGELTYSATKEFQLPDEDVFVKDLYGKSGQGTKRFYYNKGTFIDKEGTVYSPESIFKLLLNDSKESRGIVLQKIEKNHAEWRQFTPGSLCTCRVVTARLPNSELIQPLFCSFRMPVGNADADNFALGGIISPVDLETGVMGAAIGSIPVNVNGKFEFHKHPDTRQPIRGKKLPYTDNIIECAVNVHTKFKTAFVGWDVCMTEKGCCVIEGNIGWGADVVESPANIPLMDTPYPGLFEQWMQTCTAE